MPQAFQPGAIEFYEAQTDIDVYSWSPSPEGTPDAKCTQVHVHISMGGNRKLVMRIKSATSLDAIVDALTEHRKDVWGDRK